MIREKLLSTSVYYKKITQKTLMKTFKKFVCKNVWKFEVRKGSGVEFDIPGALY